MDRRLLDILDWVGLKRDQIFEFRSRMSSNEEINDEFLANSEIDSVGVRRIFEEFCGSAKGTTTY